MWPKRFSIRSWNYLLKRFHEIFTSFPVLNNVNLSNWITGSNRSLLFFRIFYLLFQQKRYLIGPDLYEHIKALQLNKQTKKLYKILKLDFTKHCGAYIYSVSNLHLCVHMWVFSHCFLLFGHYCTYFRLLPPEKQTNKQIRFANVNGPNVVLTYIHSNSVFNLHLGVHTWVFLPSLSLIHHCCQKVWKSGGGGT